MSTSSMTPEIARLDQKIDSFMQAQKETNKHLTDSIDKLAQVIIKSESQQVEINQQAAKLDKLDTKFDAMADKINTIEINQAITQDFKGHVIWLIRICIGAMVAGLFGLFWWLVKTA